MSGHDLAGNREAFVVTRWSRVDTRKVCGKSSLRYRTTSLHCFLSEGVLTAGAVIMTEDPFRLHCENFRVIGFRVYESGTGNTARGDFTGRWPGAIRPLPEWRTRYHSA
jgi:hypothetical protein